jgi:glycosyltransferase involved in cell wall biosynthesis
VASLLRRGATFRFASRELRDRLAEATGLGLGSTVVQPSAIEVGDAPSRETARRILGVPPSARLAVIASRLVPGKRIDRAIALARGRAQRVVVVGDGPERERLERAFPEATFVGLLLRPEALAWIAAADLVVSASRDEGAPTVIREARALGVPVLCEAAGDVRAWAQEDAGIEIVDG